MNVERVTLENYRSYPDADVVLPLGATAVVGANGAGKSSLISAIDYALFAGRGEGARHLRRGATTMRVAVHVEHHGEHYVIERGYSASGGGKPSLAFASSGDGGRALTLESIDATAARIAETLGVTRETLRASSLLMQGDAAAWSEADPSDRKRVLAAMLGLDVWDDLLACAKRDLGSALEREMQARADVRTLEALEHDLRTERDESAAAAEGVRAAEATLERAEHLEAERIEMLEAAQRHAAKRREFDVADGAHALAIERASAARAALEHRDEAEARLEASRVAAAPLADLEAAIARHRVEANEYRGLVLARDAAKRDADTALVVLENADAKVTALLGHLEAIPTTCPTCGQDVAGDALEHSRAVALAAVREAEAERESADAALQAALVARADAVAALEGVDEPPDTTPLEHDLRAAQDAAAVVAAAGENVTPREVMVETLERLHLEVEAAQDTLNELGGRPLADPTPISAHEAERLEATARVAGARGVLDVARGVAARIDGRIEALEARRPALEHAGDELDIALADADLYTRLVGAYSRDGVPAVIVDQQAVPALEASANGILEQLGVEMRVELRTQRATKSGNVRETLDVLVHAGGGETEYRDFSGGEKTRLNLALRIALAILLSSRRGADVRMLVVDEPEYLDVDGHERLAELLRGLAAERFDRVLLVSHEPALRDSLDQFLAVTKDEHGNSRLEMTS